MRVTKADAPMTQVSHAEVTKSSPNTIRVRQPTQIHRLLNDLHDAKALVTVALPDTGELFNSAVLAVKGGEKGGLLLDELTPRHGHDRLLEKRSLQIYGRLHGLSIRFNTELLSAGEHKGIAFYRVKLPIEVEHGQKRAYYRVRVGLGMKVPVSVLGDTDAALDGELRDISIGGIGAAFPPNAQIDSGAEVESCWIDLPGGEAISCAIKVRHTEVDTSHRELHVGASFMGLTPAQERVIQRCIHSLEREEIRRKTRS